MLHQVQRQMLYSAVLQFDYLCYSLLVLLFNRQTFDQSLKLGDLQLVSFNLLLKLVNGIFLRFDSLSVSLNFSTEKVDNIFVRDTGFF